MNIAIIAKITHPIAEPFAGGLESFTHMIARAYHAQGHDVTLYAHRDSDKQFKVVSFNDPKAFRSLQSRQYEADEYLSIVKDISTKKFDIIHNNSTSPIPLVWGARANVPVVTTLHTPPYTALKAAVSLASYSGNLKFVAVSKSLLKHWKPFIHSDISVIHNGIDLTKWQTSKRHDPYLFWYGRIVHNKGLDIAIDLAHQSKLPLYFAGPISDQSYYDTHIGPKLTSHEHYLGHLTHAEINQYLGKATALVNSGRWEEPFGLSTVEAMASGTPVIGFDRGALREVTAQKGGIVAKGTNVPSLHEALTLVKTLPKSAIVDRAKAFSVERMTKQYLDYFEEIT